MSRDVPWAQHRSWIQEFKSPCGNGAPDRCLENQDPVERPHPRLVSARGDRRHSDCSSTPSSGRPTLVRFRGPDDSPTGAERFLGDAPLGRDLLDGLSDLVPVEVVAHDDHEPYAEDAADVVLEFRDGNL